MIEALFNQTNRWLKSSLERRLALGLLVCVTLFVGVRLVKAAQGLWSLEHTRIARLQNELEQLNGEIVSQRNATVSRLQRQWMSLPADSVVAATRYYAFLHDLTAKHGWQEVKIDAASPVDEPGLGQRISISIQARAATDAVAALVDEFGSYPFLHGLVRLQLNDLSPTGRDARVNLTIEALSLPEAVHESELRLSDSSVDAENGLAATLGRHNPFRRYEPPRPVHLAPVVAEPIIDHLSKVRFVGIVQRDGVPQAWFYDSLTNSELLLMAGKSVSIAEFTGQLKSIDDQRVVISGPDHNITLNLGQDLRAALQKETEDE